MFSNTSKHSGADFFSIVKSKDDIRPPFAGQSAMRSDCRLTFHPMPNNAANKRLALTDGQ